MNFRILTTVFILLQSFQAFATIPITGNLEPSLDEQHLTYTRSITSFPDISLKSDSSYQVSVDTLSSTSGAERLRVYICNETLDSCEHLGKSDIKISGSILSKRKIYCTTPLDKLNSGAYSFSFRLSILETSP